MVEQYIRTYKHAPLDMNDLIDPDRIKRTPAKACPLGECYCANRIKEMSVELPSRNSCFCASCRDDDLENMIRMFVN